MIRNVEDHLVTIAATQKARINFIFERDFTRLKEIFQQERLIRVWQEYKKSGQAQTQTTIKSTLIDAQFYAKRFSGFTLIDNNGKVIATTDDAFQGKDFSQNKEFILAKTQPVVDLTDLDSEKLAHIYIPINSNTGFTGVLEAKSAIREDIFFVLKDYPVFSRSGKTLLACNKKNGEIEFLLTDKLAGVVQPGTRVSMDQRSLPIVQALLHNERVFSNVRDYKGVEVLAATQYIDLAGCGLVAKIDKAEALKPVDDLMKIVLVVVVVIMLVVVLVGLSMARAIGEPIHVLHRGTEVIGGGNLDYKVGTNGQDEIGQLSRAFDAMAENLKKTMASKAELEVIHEQLKAAQAQIIQTAKMAGVGQLAASVAHEINNPLCFVMNNAELLKSGGKNVVSGSAEFNESVEAILEGARRIKNITHALLDFARLNAKEDVRVNMNDVVEKALYLVYPETRNSCTIKKNISEIPQLVLGNESELMQVVVNLLLNAYQASRQGGVINVSTYGQEGFVAIEIRDNGTGINEKIMPHIFEPFFTTKNPAQGTGLGLSTSREIIKKHGGEINITSKVGEWTMAKILLPSCQKNHEQV